MAATSAPPDPSEGFEAPETLYRLTFEDPAMAGLVVTIREPSIDDLLAMTGMEVPDAKKMDPAKIRAMFKSFADLLDSWNITRKGVPVPATLEGVTSQSPAFIMKIMAAMDQITRPDPTSPPASPTGGSDGLETSIPMTPLPTSPPDS